MTRPDRFYRNASLRDAQFKALWEKIKRARSSIKGSFGDDWAQYKMAGGTRLSDRKRVRRQSQSAE